MSPLHIPIKLLVCSLFISTHAEGSGIYFDTQDIYDNPYCMDLIGQEESLPDLYHSMYNNLDALESWESIRSTNDYRPPFSNEGGPSWQQNGTNGSSDSGYTAGECEHQPLPQMIGQQASDTRSKLSKKAIRRTKCHSTVTSEYSAKLMRYAGGPGITPFVEIYRDFTGIPHSSAYSRVRAKLTEELGRMLLSRDSEDIKAAVSVISRRKPTDKLTIDESRALKRRMAPLIEKLKFEGRNVQSYGLPIFPDERVQDLLSKDEDIFTEAAYLLMQCYKTASSIKSNQRAMKKKGLANEDIQDCEQVHTLEPEYTLDDIDSVYHLLDLERDDGRQEEVMTARLSPIYERLKCISEDNIKNVICTDREIREAIKDIYSKFFSCSAGTARKVVNNGLPKLPPCDCRDLITPLPETFRLALENLRLLGNQAIREKKDARLARKMMQC